jgi:Protein of unknown function (DUF3025)
LALASVNHRAPWDDFLGAIKAKHGLPESPFELTPNDYLQRLNKAGLAAQLRNHQGLPIEFVEASPLGATSYEAMIFESGRVSTRLPELGAPIDVVHDYLNALMWFTWPRTKAALNSAQYQTAKTVTDQAISITSQRGAYRDRLTLLDESGVVVVCTEAMGALFAARKWVELFLENRAAIEKGDFQVFLLGHGLLQRLQAPFKSITAHAWVVLNDSAADIDAQMAAQVPILNRSQPLPVMGLPNWQRSWFDGEQDATFYNDQNVFRTPV